MRYIDADALTNKLESIMNRYAEQGRAEVAQDYNWAITVVSAAPTADVAPVVHGNWEEKQIVLEWCEDDVDIFYTCSACGAASPSETFYCPNCGAKMDGKEQE